VPEPRPREPGVPPQDPSSRRFLSSRKTAAAALPRPLPAAAWLGAAALLYAAVFFHFDRLRFPIYSDEAHFWPTILLFSESLVPSLEVLRYYPELNTPLPFLLFGLLEHLFGGGVQAVRLGNLLLSYAALALILLDHRSRSRTARFVPAVGVLVFPYFLGSAIFAYTDTLAALLVLLGFRYHLRGRHGIAALAFVLAISTRQYMVVFPATVALYEFARWYRERDHPAAAWRAPLLATFSLGGWYLFFGGLAPQGQTARHEIDLTAAAALLPLNSLYFLTAVGVYYVVLERLLVRDAPPVAGYFRQSGAWVAAVLLCLFVLFPPYGNPNLPGNLGLFDRTVQQFAPDVVRIAVFYALAWLAVMRFYGTGLPLLLLLSNAVMFMRAPIIWEKYALPLIVVYWYLLARGEPWLHPARAAAEPVPGKFGDARPHPPRLRLQAR
jgi:hypothetical protein